MKRGALQFMKFFYLLALHNYTYLQHEVHSAVQQNSELSVPDGIVNSEWNRPFGYYSVAINNRHKYFLLYEWYDKQFSIV